MADSKEPLSIEKALVECRSMIAGGSKSFSMASHLFGAETRDSAYLLYGWCRYCDDQIDEASVSESPENLKARLQWLRQSTLDAYEGKPSSNAVFVAFGHVARSAKIPSHYPLELLEGMAMDIRKERYLTLNDLLLYCYRVAGTVGLMMSHIMKVSDNSALRHACDLGIAMQLSNIARDVFDDAKLGRVYLPLTWLEEAKVDPDRLMERESREGLVKVARRLVTEAERFYESGDAGLRYLAFRPACTIAAARSVYSEIGKEVARRGADAWERRVWIPKARKIWLMCRAVLKVAATLPYRWTHPWRPSPITLLWREA